MNRLDEFRDWMTKAETRIGGRYKPTTVAGYSGRLTNLLLDIGLDGRLIDVETEDELLTKYKLVVSQPAFADYEVQSSKGGSAAIIAYARFLHINEIGKDEPKVVERRFKNFVAASKKTAENSFSAQDLSSSTVPPAITISNIKEAFELFQAGALSELEYNTLKEKLLSSISAAS
jgi:hypothetical protein